MTAKQSRILVFTDPHCPYIHPRALQFLRQVKADLRPTMVICTGDLVDQHTLGRFDPEPDAMGASEELQAARAQIADLRALFTHLTITVGNHESRVIRTIKKAGVPTSFIKSFHDIYGMPGTWNLVDHIEINGVYYFHGDGFTGAGGALKAATALRQSVVMGHIHSFAGVTWATTRTGRIFAANAGFLGDQEALCFQYARDNPNRGVLGAVQVVDGVPSFLPM